MFPLTEEQNEQTLPLSIRLRGPWRGQPETNLTSVTVTHQKKRHGNTLISTKTN